jgi:hypothetical protein
MSIEEGEIMSDGRGSTANSPCGTTVSIATIVASSDRMGRGHASGESGKDEDESRSAHIDDDRVCCKTSVGCSRWLSRGMRLQTDMMRKV